LDVQHRISDKNQVDIASEVAPLNSEIRETLEVFRRTTWNYLQAADLAESTVVTQEHDSRLQQLAKNRAEALATLGSQLRSITAKQIAETDAEIRALTLKRDDFTQNIKVIQDEIAFHRILLGSDLDARTRKREELSAALSAAQNELSQLQQIPEPSKAH
jgi:hypothetical protein